MRGFFVCDDMAATDHISEFAVKSQWALGGMGAFGSGVLTFLSENYYAIGAAGIVIGSFIGIHGAYWLAKIKRIEEQIKLAELEAKRAAIRD